jgi:hypothetical protein
MLDITKDIQAMTTFRRNPGKFMKHRKKSKKPLVLTTGASGAGSSGNVPEQTWHTALG